jgi:HAD superfamily hydrolase (TIGR01509 family)
VNTILFDADGVIQLGVDYGHTSLLKAIGRPAEERDTCLAAIWAAEAPALTGEAAFEVGLAAALLGLNAKCGVETVLDHWRMIAPDPSILSLVRQVRQTGVRCALASNQERNRARHMSDRLGYRDVFDREFYSCDLGHTKPSDRYFDEVVRLADLDRARTLFIDDRRENVEAALRCGLLAEQFVLWQTEDGAAALRDLLRRYGVVDPVSRADCFEPANWRLMIETPRLRLRPWTDRDRDAFAQMHADPEVMIDAPRPLTREKSDRKLDRYRAAFERDGFCQWAVETLGGDFIGYAGATWVSADHPLGPHVGAGWRLIRRAWGHGFATEATSAAFDDVFDRVGVAEVLAYTSPDNAKSQAVMARLRMRRDPHLDFTADGWTGLVWSASPALQRTSAPVAVRPK